jgi:nitrite reductase/ring-hydroxylating ferredoxin subunit
VSDCPGEIAVEWDDPVIRCPWHGWEFSLRDGHALGDAGAVKVYNAEVQGRRVVVSVNANEPKDVGLGERG